MLLYETRKLDLQTKVLDKDSDAPGRFGCNEFHIGDLMDFDSVVTFGQGLDLLTIEIENVNLDALEALASQGVVVYPSPKTLRTIQNKAKQKLFYIDNAIPTVPFSRFAYTSEIKESIANGGLKMPFVWKRTQMGYDGKGVKIINTLEDLKDLPNVECITEAFIAEKIELAVIVARNASGAMATYPVVEMEFHPEANLVEYVLCPARISPEISANAHLIGEELARGLNHVGLLAVEMFLTPDGELLVNEVAPRPHNSGHFTIESCFTNQFEQHLRAILGWPLGSTRLKIPGVMVNLVGEDGYEGDACYENIEEVLKMEGVSVHIYGKKQSRPFRKMGHITVVSEGILDAREIAGKVKENVRVISKN